MSNARRNELTHALPYARRFARALTGSQEQGDALVAEILPATLSAGPVSGDRLETRIALYRALAERTAAHATPAQGLPSRQRQLLLLTSLEELDLPSAAAVLSLPESQAASELASARRHLLDAVATTVLIIEDEPIIAMDIEELVRGCGHTIVGTAGTEAEAVALATQHRPGLILADINLGHGGDGTTAVARILQHHQAPVIFVTAYPERLLTGDGLEPAFVITKPFEPMALAVATYQAVNGTVPMG